MKKFIKTLNENQFENNVKKFSQKQIEIVKPRVCKNCVELSLYSEIFSPYQKQLKISLMSPTNNIYF